MLPTWSREFDSRIPLHLELALRLVFILSFNLIHNGFNYFDHLCKIWYNIYITIYESSMFAIGFMMDLQQKIFQEEIVMKIINHLFKREKKKQPKAVDLKVKGSEENFNYGTDVVGFFLRSNDYSWTSKNSKKVILVNVKECKNRVNVLNLCSLWRGTGHSEWEVLLADWFVEAVLEALKSNKSDADITCLFNKDLKASGGRIFSQEDVYYHIIPSFQIVENNEDEMKVKLLINVAA